MTVKNKETQMNVFWENKVDETKREGAWHFFIGKNILIRKIPYNYEFIAKETCISCYYNTLQGAVKKAVDHLAARRMQGSDTVEALLASLQRLEKKVEEILPEIKKSIDAYEETNEEITVSKMDAERYFCTVCSRNHIQSTAIGQRHLKFKDVTKKVEEKKDDRYFCRICDRNHLSLSTLGQDHLKYKEDN